MSENKAGLYSKFIVRDQNGESAKSGTFVLRPFNEDGEVNDPSAITALRAYADDCLFHGKPELSRELTDWLNDPKANEATWSLNR